MWKSITHNEVFRWRHLLYIQGKWNQWSLWFDGKVGKWIVTGGYWCQLSGGGGLNLLSCGELENWITPAQDKTLGGQINSKIYLPPLCVLQVNTADKWGLFQKIRKQTGHISAALEKLSDVWLTILGFQLKTWTYLLLFFMPPFVTVASVQLFIKKTSADLCLHLLFVGVLHLYTSSKTEQTDIHR